MRDLLHHDRIPIHHGPDVLVIGAGTSGCDAALAARETAGVRVTLVERYGFLGGASTQALDTFYGFYTPDDEPRRVVGGNFVAG
ncbi:MAG: FAD-dependent oxidoreductase [Planctomycetota bacterium]|jgi:succinate dehydrogenase/fumarate reductase flavoprotein subunit